MIACYKSTVFIYPPQLLGVCMYVYMGVCVFIKTLQLLFAGPS